VDRGGQNDDFRPLTYTLGGEGHGVQGQICDILTPDLSPTTAERDRDEGGDESNDEESLTMDEDVRRERMRVLNGGSAEDVLQVFFLFNHFFKFSFFFSCLLRVLASVPVFFRIRIRGLVILKYASASGKPINYRSESYLDISVDIDKICCQINKITNR
jgi:hypothetical protein